MTQNATRAWVFMLLLVVCVFGVFIAVGCGATETPAPASSVVSEPAIATDTVAPAPPVATDTVAPAPPVATDTVAPAPLIQTPVAVPEVFHPLSDTVAIITGKSGATCQIPAQYLVYSDNKFDRLIKGLWREKEFEEDTIPFDRIQSIEFVSGDDSPYSQAPLTTTVTLRDGMVLVDLIDRLGYLHGPTETGSCSANLAEIQRVDFQSRAQPELRMATIVPRQGNPVRVPLDSLRTRYMQGGWSGAFVRNGLRLRSGLEVPFDQIRSFEVTRGDPLVEDTTVTIYFKNGEQLTELLDFSEVYGGTSDVELQAVHDLGVLEIPIIDLARVDLEP